MISCKNETPSIDVNGHLMMMFLDYKYTYWDLIWTLDPYGGVKSLARLVGTWKLLDK
jgi:hypothetical protein